MEDTKKKLTEGERQERNGRLVKNEVMCCVSGLVEELFKKEVFQYEDIENLYQYVCPECGNGEPDLSDYETPAGAELLYKCPYCGKSFDDEPENEPQEIFEWWLVTSWLYKKLQAEGEPVYSYEDFNYFWGRTTTGQAILLDSVIDRMCNKLGW